MIRSAAVFRASGISRSSLAGPRWLQFTGDSGAFNLLRLVCDTAALRSIANQHPTIR